MRAGDLEMAERAFTECLELARGLGDRIYVAAALCALGEIALSRDLPEVAGGRLVEALVLYRELGDERDCAECLHALGGVAAADGRALDEPASGEPPTRYESDRARCRRRRRRPSTSASAQPSHGQRTPRHSRAHEPKGVYSRTTNSTFWWRA